MNHLRFGGFCAPDAEPYPQGVIHALPAAGLFFAGSGGGGGAAQLLEGALLRRAVEEAANQVFGEAGDARLRGKGRLIAFVNAINRHITSIRETTVHRGASAEGAAILCEDSAIHCAVVGLCRVYAVRRDRVELLVRERSLASATPRRSPAPEAWMSGIPISVFGAGDDFKCPAVTLREPGDVSLFICSKPIYDCGAGDGELHAWIAEAARAPDLEAGAQELWRRGRRALVERRDIPEYEPFNFDRRAAALLLRNSQPPGGRAPPAHESQH